MSRWIFSFVLMLVSCTLLAQKQEEIELLHADKFTVDKYTPKGANKLKGNVQLKHQDALMFCDSALLYDNNSLKAEGHVKIIENDSLTITGDSLRYDGNTKMAHVRGHVVVDNKTSILKTNYLDFNRETSIGTYFNGGEIDSRQEKIHLTSKRGYYYSDQKLFHYKTDVVMKHPDYTIYTDTMHYSTDLEKTWFFGPTNIEFDKRKIYCEYGWFDQLADRANFIKNAKIFSSGQILKGDTIDYDQKEKIGISKCNVVLIDTSEKIEVTGDYAVYYETDSTSFVTQNMLMKQDMSGDTFYLVADTLFSLTDTATKQRMVKTYHGTRFFKKDMQGKCDSLIYWSKDSIIYLYTDPILWSDDNQITADSIRLTMKKGELDKMYMDQNAFIIAREDETLFNQIKGRNMIGYFVKSELSKVDVFGNGQTIYYPREEDQSLIGVNETKCSNMTIRIDSSKIKKISFYDRPTAKLTPSDDMPIGGLQLDRFIWRVNERPSSVTDLIFRTSTPFPKVKPIKLDVNPSSTEFDAEEAPNKSSESEVPETLEDPNSQRIISKEKALESKQQKMKETRSGAQEKEIP